jgi:hypothetical protein
VKIRRPSAASRRRPNLSEHGEMLVLFCFGGGNVVHDVDYVT